MKRSYFFLLAAFVCSLSVSASSQRNDIASDQGTTTSVQPLFHPEPEYPRALGNRLVEGEGLFQLDLDYESGAVIQVQILKSTGSSGLDQAAVKAFRKWRFPARSLKALRIPVDFSTPGHTSDQLREARKYATFSPAPTYPTAARFEYLQSSGIYQFIVNYATGRVIDVKILQTSGSGILDKPIVNTFRTWKFRPHTVRTVTTRFGFMFDRKGMGNAGP